MRVAALDLGTNTFLCLIAEVESGRVQSVLSDRIWLVRLGQEVHRTRRFHPEALQRARQALQEARREIDAHGVDTILAVATSAARDVSNGHELIQICEELNVPVEIIEGGREAQLTFAGATSELSDTHGCAVIDVGGGSTEIIVQERSQLCFQSLDMGSVRLTEQFFTTYPIAADALERAQRHLRAMLQTFRFDSAQVKRVIAVAGTPTTLAAMALGISFQPERIEGRRLSATDLDRWVGLLAQLRPEEIQARYHIEEKRADVIAAGTLILRETLAYLGVSHLDVSTKGVRFGVAASLGQQKGIT